MAVIASSIAALMIFGAAPPLSAARPATAEPLLGNCHMGSCSYSREIRRAIMRETPAGRLFRVTLLGGEQGEAGDDGPSEDAPIVWNREPHDIFVFCSTRLPAVMMRLPGRRTLQTDLLDLGGPEAITTILVSSANIYMEICHGLRDRDLADETAGLGYRPIPPALLNRGIDIERPEEIFSFVRD